MRRFRFDDPLVPALPPSVPQSRKGLSRHLGAGWLRLSGWRLVGQFPDLAKAVIIVAPHSSNWDGLHGLAMRQVVGIDVSFMAKRELFWWPLGSLLRGLGIFPVDRGASADLVDVVAAEFARRERFWLGAAPEGTRKPVTRWKTGFWRIARAARVPIVTAWIHYPERQFGIGEVFETTADMAADLARIRAVYVERRGAGGKRAV